jgi:hypothetical protein
MEVGVGLGTALGVALGREVAEGAGLGVGLGGTVAVFSGVEVGTSLDCRTTVGVGPAQAEKMRIDSITKKRVFTNTEFFVIISSLYFSSPGVAMDGPWPCMTIGYAWPKPMHDPICITAVSAEDDRIT